MSAAVAEHVNTIWDAGVLYDLDTGEILNTERTAFRVDSIDAAEWVLDRLADREGRKLALVERKRAIDANLDAMITDEDRAIAGLHRRFDQELADFARSVLEAAGWKSKTLKTAYGQISFRMTAGTHKIVDQLAAVAWAKRVAPSIVKVAESVNVTDVLPQLDDGEEPGWLETTPGGERCAINTLVGKAR